MDGFEDDVFLSVLGIQKTAFASASWHTRHHQWDTDLVQPLCPPLKQSFHKSADVQRQYKGHMCGHFWLNEELQLLVINFSATKDECSKFINKHIPLEILGPLREYIALSTQTNRIMSQIVYGTCQSWALWIVLTPLYGTPECVHGQGSQHGRFLFQRRLISLAGWYVADRYTSTSAWTAEPVIT